jgi:hypothetical protein
VIYRHQVLRNLHLDGLGEFMELQRQKNELLTAAGLAPYSVWAPAFGGLHHLVLEAEFRSLEQFEQHQAKAKTIEGYGAANAAQLKLVIESSASDRMIKLTLPG